MGSFPSAAAMVRTPEQHGIMDQYSKIMGIQGAQQEQQLRQQQIQGATLQNQQAQKDMDDQAKIEKLFADAGSDTEAMKSAIPKVMAINPKMGLQFQADILKSDSAALEQKKAVIGYHSAVSSRLAELAGGVKDEAGFHSAIGQALSESLIDGQTAAKYLSQPFNQDEVTQIQRQALSAKDQLDQADKVITQKETERHNRAEEGKVALDIAPPTQAQRDTFVKTTLPSFAGLNQAQRDSFAQQASQARTVAEFNKVAETADATEKTEQMHSDSLAQTKALVGNKFAEAGLTSNDKVWTDPQRGFAGALAQAKQTKASIVAGADGNGLLTALVPTMEVLGVNHAAGISRISPTEAAAAGTPPEWATRWNAWASKAMAGKLTPELAKQGQELMDIVVSAAHQKAIQSSALIAKGHQLTPDQVPAMDKDGNVTTLDKLLGTTGAQGGGPPNAKAAPSGATHVGVGSVDKKKHYLDANGKDLGLAE